MGTNVQGIQPSSLTVEELLKYAYLRMDQNGLPLEWCQALLETLEALFDELNEIDEQI